MLLRKVKANVDVFARIGVAVFVPRQAADDVATFLDRRIHQLGCARIAHDAFLRKGDDLDGGVILHLLARQQQAARGLQPADRADVAEQPEECRAVLDAGLDGAHGARGDLGRIVIAFVVVCDLDGLRQGTRDVRPHDLAKETFVGMVVQVEKTRQDKASSSVDFLLPFARELRADGRNLLALDRDIDRLLLVPHPSITNDDVHNSTNSIVARRLRPGL